VIKGVNAILWICILRGILSAVLSKPETKPYMDCGYSGDDQCVGDNKVQCREILWGFSFGCIKFKIVENKVCHHLVRVTETHRYPTRTNSVLTLASASSEVNRHNTIANKLFEKY
jgi:hypothetical protein